MEQRNIQTREGYEWWDRLCKLPRYGFLLAPSGNRVVKTEGIGDWIDMHAAQEIVDDAQSEINSLKQQLKARDADRVTVDAAALRKVLVALVGHAYQIRELHATRGLPGGDNPIDQLLNEFNAWAERGGE